MPRFRNLTGKSLRLGGPTADPIPADGDGVVVIRAVPPRRAVLALPNDTLVHGTISSGCVGVLGLLEDQSPEDITLVPADVAMTMEQQASFHILGQVWSPGKMVTTQGVEHFPSPVRHVAAEARLR